MAHETLILNCSTFQESQMIQKLQKDIGSSYKIAAVDLVKSEKRFVFEYFMKDQ